MFFKIFRIYGLLRSSTFKMNYFRDIVILCQEVVKPNCYIENVFLRYGYLLFDCMKCAVTTNIFEKFKAAYFI